MTAPVKYIEAYLSTVEADALLAHLWNELPWIDVTEARREYWSNDLDAPYTYGSGVGRRTYQAQTWDRHVFVLRNHLAFKTGARFEGCFLNGYANEKNALGWHSDDSPEIDAKEPIAVVSLGAPRSIMFRPIGGGPKTIEQVTLGHGSLLLMEAGMQQSWQHKIPRHSAPCGQRVSLTYRSLVAPA